METLGQKRVVVNYGKPSQEQVDLATQFKEKVAELIDILEKVKADDVFKSVEKLRICSIAQTELETACMYAVKAIYKE